MSNHRFIIATHELVYGAPQALKDFLNHRENGDVCFIAHPLLDKSNGSYAENYVSGSIKGRQTKKLLSWLPAAHTVEFLLTLYWALWWVYSLTSKSTDKVVFIGANPLNAAAGLILRSFGVVDISVYYTIDFTPQRFESRAINRLYHWLDLRCAQSSDETWNVSPRINEGRKQFHNLRFLKGKQYVTPIGVWDILDTSQNIRNENEIIFVGTVLQKQGLHKVIESLPSILIENKNVTLTIIGDGEYMPFIKSLINSLNLQKHVSLLGLVEDRKEVFQRLSKASVAVATYDPSIASFSYYADPTKYKDYLSAGLPMVMTDVAHNCAEIEANGCGVIVAYDTTEIAQAIIRLIKSPDCLAEQSERSISYVRQFHWSKIFSKRLERLFADQVAMPPS